MHSLITGATGFIGTELTKTLLSQGHKVTALVRDREKAAHRLGPDVSHVTTVTEIPNEATIDAIFNLAGAPIADRLWTRPRRAVLLNSRLETTGALVELVGRLETKPKVMISASAAGYYGRQADDWVEEDTPPQDIFMSHLCKAWEDAASGVEAYGVRLVIPRISVVVGQGGGLLGKLMLPARLGLGARQGDGRQYFPWIHKTDLVRMMVFMLEHTDLSGPYNAVAPQDVRQGRFTKCLGRVLHRPAFLVVPAFVFNLLPGGMADLFLAGQRLSASRIRNAGFDFDYPTLESALREAARGE